MKRLVKKSNRNLYHATDFDSFIKICDSGAIMGHNKTNADSGALNGNGVYISRVGGPELARSIINNADNDYKIGVLLEVNVNEKFLKPSFDYKDYNYDTEDENGNIYYITTNGESISEKEFNENELTWEKTLEIFDECIYEGDIPLSNINWVKFYAPNYIVEKYKEYFFIELSVTDAIKFINLIRNKL